MSEASEVLEELRSRGWTLGIAESLTGGAVAAECVSVPGASAVLLGAVVAYATPVKHTLLGVDADLLDEHGPVHPLVAAQMADGVRSAVAVDGRRADVGISTTGIAGPDSPDGQQVGTVHIGAVTPEGARTAAFLFSGDRAQIRAQTVQEAFAVLLELLRE
ncbi:CinA family protein [Microbacterium sp. ZW T6_19]|uniref:CinA family protein n=1 Tax=Microbacterium sp. ZW T6_19 TaxID=3378082 RepID=UPI0038553FD9